MRRCRDSILDLLREAGSRARHLSPRSRRRSRRSPTTSPTTTTTSTTATAPGCSRFAELAEVPLAARALAEVRRRLSRHRRHAAPLRDHPPPDHRDDRGCRRRDASGGSPSLRRKAPPTCAMPPAAVVAFSAGDAATSSSAPRVPVRARLPPSAHRCASWARPKAWSPTCSRATAAIPTALPPEWREQAPPRGSRPMRAMSADFIAGMTDRYALAEHRRLFDATPDLR